MAYENMSAAVRRDLQRAREQKKQKLDKPTLVPDKPTLVRPCSPQTCPFPDDLCLGCRNADSCKEEANDIL